MLAVSMRELHAAMLVLTKRRRTAAAKAKNMPGKAGDTIVDVGGWL